MAKDTFFCPKQSICCQGRLISLEQPRVMGIINLTPDSFYAGSRSLDISKVLKKAADMLEEGATFIDLGAASSRPGSPLLDAETEQSRLLPALRELRQSFPSALFSVDTYNASTAAAAVHEGADMINDISGGSFDADMISRVAGLGVPFVIMHTSASPDRMQQNTRYGHLIKDIAAWFSERIRLSHMAGIADLILDPGFGFGKTLAQNYQLLDALDYFQIFELPIMVGVSRKSMISKVLDCQAEQALNGTTVLHALALQKGAGILRVHDVKEAVEAIKLMEFHRLAQASL